MAKKEITVEFEPIKEYEHYIKKGSIIYGVNRETNLEKWQDQKLSFMAKMDGVDMFFSPTEFFVSGDSVYFSVSIGDKIFYLKQSDGEIKQIKELPIEDEIKRSEFTGTVGEFEIEYKENPKYNTWKHVKTKNGHFLNHQSSKFVFPVGDKILIYVNDVKCLFVVYIMPNGWPAKNSLLSIGNGDLTIY